MFRLSGLLLIALLALYACGEPAAPGLRDREAASRTLFPEDPELQSIYMRSCRSCHTIAATRSPLTGDIEAWAPRLDKGMGVLVENVINGIGGMPPLGLCMDCSPEQFEALTRFMATAE